VKLNDSVAARQAAAKRATFCRVTGSSAAAVGEQHKAGGIFKKHPARLRRALELEAFFVN
jgi:hypothetical protein